MGEPVMLRGENRLAITCFKCGRTHDPRVGF